MGAVNERKVEYIVVSIETKERKAGNEGIGEGR